MNNENNTNADNPNPPPIPIQNKGKTYVPPLNYGQREWELADARFAEQFTATEEKMSAWDVIDNLLKKPGRLIYEINENRYISMSMAVITLILLSSSIYGLIVGSFAGGAQLYAVPIKLVYGLALTALVCFPSLYIFLGLNGGKQSLKQIAAILILCLGLSTLLLLGFAPIAWVFSVSTGSIGFMTTLHVACWLISVHYGIELMRKAFNHLNGMDMKVLTVWKIIFVIVTLQMITSLRPLLGDFKDSWFSDKKSFVSHYVNILD
jgi:hypothetical protein